MTVEKEPQLPVIIQPGEISEAASTPTNTNPGLMPPSRRIDTEGYLTQRADPNAVLRQMIRQRRGIL